MRVCSKERGISNKFSPCFRVPLSHSHGHPFASLFFTKVNSNVKTSPPGDREKSAPV